MNSYGEKINNLINKLSKLPGIGNKTATRMAFSILKKSNQQVKELIDSIVTAKKYVKYCKECYALTDLDICKVCSDKTRDHSTIMVVETTQDMLSYEKTKQYKGVYHILHGTISPIQGISIEDIKLKELIQRLKGDIKEVIIATNSSLSGETTAMYISKLVKPTNIKITRIASGIPVGCDIENIDEVTLLRALKGRHEL